MTEQSVVHYHQYVRPPSNGMAIAALVTGILAILPGVFVLIPVLGLFFLLFALVPAVLAVVFGHLGLAAAKRLNGLGLGQAKAGLILGYVTIGLMVASTLFWVAIMATSAVTYTGA